ncbi:MAG: biotin/lipoate A/B protein ligase family protein [Chthoniobacterales bacterium]
MLFDRLQLFDDGTPRNGTQQMALDETLLGHLHEATLRFYTWSQHAVTFGYFQSKSEVLTKTNGEPLTRRWSGGGVVFHDGLELTYSLLVPRQSAAARLRPSVFYEAVHSAIADCLSAAGQSVWTSQKCEASRPDLCFQNLAKFDVDSEKGKLAGAAQRRTRIGIIHQGSIRADSQAQQFLREKLPLRFADEVLPFKMNPAFSAEADLLAQTRYASAEWINRVP